MTDKEFKRLNRNELIEVIYQLQRNELQYQQTIDSLKRRLDSKELFLAEKISVAGSIAEASLSINGVFDAAQKAADNYIAEVHRLNETAETRSRAMLSEAEAKSRAVITEAASRSKAILDEAKEKSEAMLAEAEAKSKEMLDEATARSTALSAEAEKKSSTLVSDAEKQAHAIMAKAKQESEALRADAEREISERWQEYRTKAAELMRTQKELKALLD